MNVPPGRRCWRCAVDGVLTFCVPGEIYCEAHRRDVEREVAWR